MKTLFVTVLKIALVAFLLWWALHHAPILVMPIVGVIGLAVSLAVAFVLASVVGLSVGLVVVLTVLAVMLSIAAALAPIWLPVLAIVGLVALCRPKNRRSAA
ncbi:hypothetical protein [Synoicihabitans lomoniglobus]|uniref:Uncharacterized protein n=1 Tax=Synoicihabitans lomoniglobus TaxID=2909285 RepID=A0AAF0CIH7_9BACT|nr:hypothetical protein [Opitutaceae bacterium LMO-M01]WED65417.1 hypothetical protein PXH66_00960 [Opitutaceae bacterium LMO-M01]